MALGRGAVRGVVVGERDMRADDRFLQLQLCSEVRWCGDRGGEVWGHHVASFVVCDGFVGGWWFVS